MPLIEPRIACLLITGASNMLTHYWTINLALISANRGIILSQAFYKKCDKIVSRWLELIPYTDTNWVSASDWEIV